MPKIFSRSTVVEKREYLVDGLIAIGTSNIILAKSGAGKSFLCFGLATSVALGKEFIGLKTKKSKVLIIDEEQTIEDSESRVAQTLNFYNVQESHNIVTAFREGLSLKDESLIHAINEVNPDVVIIDSLTSVSRGLNMNDMNDSTKFVNLHQNCKNKNITIIVIHHISIHTPLTYNTFLTCEASSLSMCSTAFINTVDAFFILYNPNTNKNINQLLVRPAPKRYKIKYGIFETGMEQTENTLHFKELEEKSQDDTIVLTDQEEIVIGLFEGKEFLQVKDMYNDSSGRIGSNKSYSISESLKVKKLIDCKNIGDKKNNYYLTELGKKYLESLKIDFPKLVKE